MAVGFPQFRYVPWDNCVKIPVHPARSSELFGVRLKCQVWHISLWANEWQLHKHMRTSHHTRILQQELSSDYTIGLGGAVYTAQDSSRREAGWWSPVSF